MAGVRNIAYACLCGYLFTSLDELRSHRLRCEHFKRLTRNPNGSLMTPSESKILKMSTDFIGVLNADFVLLNETAESPDVGNDDTTATNFWGRRLPRRTKVPYLSRAVPLSIDHSYERCQCGAVFVTTQGKRQHQARFCKIVKNKSEEPAGREGLGTDSERTPIPAETDKLDPVNKGVKFIVLKELTAEGFEVERYNEFCDENFSPNF